MLKAHIEIKVGGKWLNWSTFGKSFREEVYFILKEGNILSMFEEKGFPEDPSEVVKMAFLRYKDPERVSHASWMTGKEIVLFHKQVERLMGQLGVYDTIPDIMGSYGDDFFLYPEDWEDREVVEDVRYVYWFED